jgi:nucleoside-diphosphate-sugar epimerase
MRILFIGGTRFVGPHAVRRLCELGHDVTVFHRGKHEAELPPWVKHLHSRETATDPRDRRQLGRFAKQLAALRPDVVVDMVAFTRDDAAALVRTFAGVAGRAVVASSIDVYRAFGRLHRTEPGAPDPTPLTEDSPLREKPSVHGGRSEKRDVEEAVLGEPRLPGTVLRFPAVYGPGDYRLDEYTRRMFDGRPSILLDEAAAAWRFTHGYVEDVAEAVVLAVTHEDAAGRTYNVGEAETPQHLKRLQDLAAAADWNGRFVPLPLGRLPSHLREDLDWRQDWTVDTRRIRDELGYREVVPYEEGLRRTVQWQHTNSPELLDRAALDYPAEDAAAGAVAGL